MKFPKIYAKKELTKELVHDKIKRYDVVLYKDQSCKNHYCTFQWWNSNKPTKRNKKITVNYANYELVWV